MIHIYRHSRNGVPHDCDINVFHGREWIKPEEVRLVRRLLFFYDSQRAEDYVHAEPAAPGMYAFGGSFLYTSNRIYPEFNKPIPLHDRDMSKERG